MDGTLRIQGYHGEGGEGDGGEDYGMLSRLDLRVVGWVLGVKVMGGLLYPSLGGEGYLRWGRLLTGNARRNGRILQGHQEHKVIKVVVRERRRRRRVEEGGDGVMRGRWIQELGEGRMWLGLYLLRGRLRLF